jgi:hypothetical protein
MMANHPAGSLWSRRKTGDAVVIFSNNCTTMCGKRQTGGSNIKLIDFNINSANLIACGDGHQALNGANLAAEHNPISRSPLGSADPSEHSSLIGEAFDTETTLPTERTMPAEGQKADVGSNLQQVRYGSKADLDAGRREVRYGPQTDISLRHGVEASGVGLAQPRSCGIGRAAGCSETCRC